MLECQDTRYFIGEFLLKEKDRFYKYSMEDIAKLTHTSKSILVRFSKILGFNGWEDLFDTVDGTVWLPGDSRLLEEHLNMNEPDVILFDFSDNPWHITLDGAIKLANTYPNSDLICIHWGSVDAPTMSPFNGNPESLIDKVVNPERIKVMAPGEQYILMGKKL